mgnify:CR=1 FL=1
MSIRYLLYRWTSVLMHRFDLHYAPIHGPFQDGRKQRWCQWCGMRDWYIEPLVTVEELRRAAKQLGIEASQGLCAVVEPASIQGAEEGRGK